MPTTDYSELPYPAAADADNVPADLMALVTTLDDGGRLVYHGTSRADLDTTFADAPLSSVVLLNIGGDRELWHKGPNVWQPLVYTPSTPVDLSLKSGIAVSQGRTPQVSRTFMGGRSWQVFMTGAVEANTGNIASGATLLSLPAAYRPDRYAIVPCAVSVDAGAAGQLSINPGGDVHVWVGGFDDAAWVSLECSFFVSASPPTVG